MPARSVIQKLQVRPGNRLAAVNAPDDLARLLRDSPEQVSITSEVAGAHAVLLFVRDTAELAREWPPVRESRRDDALLWIAYPKKTGTIRTDISRDSGWEPVIEAGLDAVSLVAIDETWSAIRFRRDPALRAERAARGALGSGHSGADRGDTTP